MKLKTILFNLEKRKFFFYFKKMLIVEKGRIFLFYKNYNRLFFLNFQSQTGKRRQAQIRITVNNSVKKGKQLHVANIGQI